MKAAFYNPYLDTLGGGERYTLAFAKSLVENGYDVFLQWREETILDKLSKRFGLDSSGIHIINDIKRGDGYEVSFWVSDGSVPLMRSRKNFLHFQIPFKDVGGKSLMNKMKLFRINKIICNSNFTKKVIDKEYGIESMVIYPPIDVERIKAKKKRNVILSVGRFSQLTQSKRQDILVNTFKSLIKKGLKGWKMVLAGGVEVGVDDSFLKLKKASQNYPIEIKESPSFDELVSLYSSSKIFWSASGYGEDERTNPQKVEHFGISVVEAMSAGVVPIIFKAGGHRELIKSGKDGLFWTTKGELLKKTLGLINDRDDLIRMSDYAVRSSKKFGYAEFFKQVSEIL